MVDTVQHSITAKRIPLISANNQTHKESKRRDKRRFKDRLAKDAITSSGQEESIIYSQTASNQESSSACSGAKKKRIDIIV
jgi:hypothetical protein